MNHKRTILEYIAEALPDRRVQFVFPSAVPAQFWARAAAEALIKPITPNRFIAWDTFKAQTLSINQKDKKPINQAIRTLFASSLLRENAQKGKAFLTDYINPLYASSYSAFIGSLARLFPALEAVLTRSKAAEIQEVPYFADLRRIRERYVQFLEDHRLYEPAWNRADFVHSEDRWVLFFPELTEDWEEYREELTALAEQAGEKPVRIVPLDAVGSQNQDSLPEPIQTIVGAYAGRYIEFSCAEQEYRWLALMLRRLLDEGPLCPEEIGVSVSQNVDLERLIQELLLYDIQASPREGLPLTEHPGGRLFAALAACPAEKWSFQVLKNLLLDKAFPWKHNLLIDGLMDFGLQYRCVSGYMEGPREIDVWERTFEYHPNYAYIYEGAKLRGTDIADFYKKLKTAILGLVQSAHFGELLIKWKQFKKEYFDDAGFNPAINKIIGKAITALKELEKIEQSFPELSGNARDSRGKAFPVFQAYIQEQNYVYQSHQGIPIYNYKVAAGICPTVHFIINMNQEDAAAVYTGGISFLREDRKKTLGIQDRDISGEFIKAYRFSGSFPIFTLSRRTFNGPAIPHRRLFELLGTPIAGADLQFTADPYLIEAAMAGGKPAPEPGGFQFYPSKIQKQGWQSFTTLRKPPIAEDLRISPVSDPALRAALQERLTYQARFRRQRMPQPEGTQKDETPYITPTDLNEYIACPFKWVLQKALLLKEKQTEIETIDQRDLGVLYHRILERFFKRIKNEDSSFKGENLFLYKTYIIEETQNALKEARSREGAFQESIYAMLERRITAALTDYLTQDLSVLMNAEIIGSEYALEKTYSPIEPRLIGKTDLALEYRDGGLILLDFKTGTMPTKKELLLGDREYPEDLQMAAYIAMIEDDGDKDSIKTVKTARFYSIDNREFQRVVSEKEEHEKDIIPRIDYTQAVEAVDKVFAKVTETMNLGAYPVPKYPKRKNCAGCKVSSVCRIPFVGGELISQISQINS
ncbi:MAG: PD-(D/E)XK nuclease family protein [Treponema sp.]|jgi:CRISPR/Cas system-associated exonuclease Cas4 (RecB family)|nr:PD-(D/E)XK nuclease family protein [Treponema sp.]